MLNANTKSNLLKYSKMKKIKFILLITVFAYSNILFAQESIDSCKFNSIQDTISRKFSERSLCIHESLVATVTNNTVTINEAKELIKEWIQGKENVRILGAGRALLAASIGVNRLAHTGVHVSFIGGMVPMPNSCQGGGIIAASASGQTKHVIEAMAVAKKNNPNIKIIGIASVDKVSEEFKKYCDCFIGIHSRISDNLNPLSALADEEEMVIAEFLDALIVLSAKELGFDDSMWRLGHEDIGPTGPYSVKEK